MKAYRIKIEIYEKTADRAKEKFQEVVGQIMSTTTLAYAQSGQPLGEGPMVPVCNVVAGECEA